MSESTHRASSFLSIPTHKKLAALAMIGLLLTVISWCAGQFSAAYATPSWSLRLTKSALVWQRVSYQPAPGVGKNENDPVAQLQPRQNARIASSSGITISLWVPFVVFALMWCWSQRPVIRLRRRQRSRAGLCAICSYNLRGSTNECSECGAPIINRL